MPQENRLPQELLNSLAGIPGYDRDTFEAIHKAQKQVTAVRTNPLKGNYSTSFDFEFGDTVPWTKYGRYLPARPSFTFDPLFHAGAYYVQEASSMFLEQALQQTADLSQPLLVLDLCAAPGGKSTHIQSLISNNAVLVSNELIRTRVNILMENITKWGAANTIVTNNDPADFTHLHNLFDVIVVDAPCSGSGLFRKDPEAISEWSLGNVNHCSMRQQRILADIWPALKPGGILIYSTCSYSAEEDERIADWVTETLDATTVPLAIKDDWNIVTTMSPVCENIGYRFYPYKLDGEGFYLSCFRKNNSEADVFYNKPIKQQVDKKIISLASQWIAKDDDIKFYQHKEQVFAMPAYTYDLFLQLQSKLNIRKAGIKIGDGIRDEIIPDHALALSMLYNNAIKTIELDKESAIEFLRRNDFSIDQLSKGWLIITYKSLPLGWIKSLGNRFNNYYPKEWRIRK